MLNSSLLRAAMAPAIVDAGSTVQPPDESLVVQYDEAKGTFFAKTHWLNSDIARGFPNRKFKTDRWLIPTLRVNAVHMLELGDAIVITPEAELVAEALLEDKKYRPEIPFPKDYIFKTKPYPHQPGVLDFMWGTSKAFLNGDMGVGKSKLAIDLGTARYLNGQIKSMMVVCPAATRANWESEWETHCPLSKRNINMWVLDKTGDKSVEIFKKHVKRSQQTDQLSIAIVSVESFSISGRNKTMVQEFLDNNEEDGLMIVIDESHTIKSPDSNRTKAIMKIAKYAKYRYVMTGTRITNGVEDAYAQYQFLDPNILGVGSYVAFKARYCIIGGFGNKNIVGYKHMSEFKELIDPWTVYVDKAEVLPDLPPKEYELRKLKMTSQQKKAYDQIKSEGILELKSSIKESDNPQLTEYQGVLAILLALQQITGGYIGYDKENGTRGYQALIPDRDNPKLIEIIRIAEEEKEHSIIVWAKYTHEVSAIMELLTLKYGAESVVRYDGQVNKANRAEAKRKFNCKEARFFVSNPATGGTGLTLNAADRVVYMSNSYLLIHRLQSEDRNHRIGQTGDKVKYYDLQMIGTVDTAIMASIRKKKSMMDYLRGNGKSLIDTLAEEMD